MDANAIEIENVTKRYKARKDASAVSRIKYLFKPEKQEYITALRNVNFNVKEKEIFGLLGPNGAGKTTLVKIISGLLLPDYGRVTVNGYDTIKNRAEVRTSVNILLSSGWIIFDYKLTVFQNLRFWAVCNGVRIKDADEKITQALKSVGLEDKKYDFPENLSAGLRQKMNLARCLLIDRPIYLFDEPTANIDPYSGSSIREMIKKLKSEKKTVILATNNLWEAEELCDRVAILNKGSVIALDSTERIKRLGKDILTINLKKLDRDIIKKLSEMGFIDKVLEEKNALVIYGNIRKKNMAEILEACRDYCIEGIDIRESSLKDVFLELITEEEKAMTVR